jgi:hypothetical protein
MSMKIRCAYAALFCLLSAQAAAAEFCDGSIFVSLDQVLQKKDHFLNRRVQTHAILRTDAKEYSRISLDEKSDFSVLTTADDESTAYHDRMKLPSPPHAFLIDDFFDKVKERDGEHYKKDLTKIGYYRQDVIACGRLVQYADSYRFALDDMQMKRSYLLPWKRRVATAKP